MIQKLKRLVIFYLLLLHIQESFNQHERRCLTFPNLFSELMVVKGMLRQSHSQNVIQGRLEKECLVSCLRGFNTDEDGSGLIKYPVRCMNQLHLFTASPQSRLLWLECNGRDSVNLPQGNGKEGQGYRKN